MTSTLGLRPFEIFSFFQCEDRLYESKSDVYRCQLLTYKDGARAESVERIINAGLYLHNLKCSGIIKQRWLFLCYVTLSNII